MTDVIRTAVDKILDNPVTIDNIENGTAAASSGQESDGLEGIFEGMMGGDGKGFAEILANIGTNFTEKMENKGGKKDNKSKRRVIFEEWEYIRNQKYESISEIKNDINKMKLY